MKRLTISIKTPGAALGDFRKAMRKARKGNLRPTTEIAFDNQRDFSRFVENLHVLSGILIYQPRSIYELAKRLEVDVSNLNKIILFLEQTGAVRIVEEVASGRRVRRPVVDYDRVEFRLAG